MCVAMSIFLLSLTGIPPFGGFIGKLYLFAALVKAEIYWLLIIAIINVVISLYYYAYIIREMFLEKPVTDTAVPLTPIHTATLAFLAVPILILGIYWEPLYNYITLSLQFVISP